ncbi:dihydrofolate reductase family protein [Citricoccus sp. SGAir0253]|uniref:dihydrofolate reductase family protein n=1 Tax=Citricoccus sp. SGAir0253 TaxID=2567881 RepID=UPI001FEF3DF6|nr:dihydrofolate reductase family protein [Citricoccus sp. SGAir0253]
MWTTLDGYVAGPADEMDWLEPDDRMMAYETALVADADALLLGRVTHGDFAGTWPAVARNEAEPPAVRHYARRVDEMPKIVVSGSGQTTAWANTSHLEALDAQTVARIKDGDDGYLVVYGSLTLIASLQGLDAIDEYHLLVHPTAICQGKALFASPTRLRLLSAETFPSGVTLMRHTPR